MASILKNTLKIKNGFNVHFFFVHFPDMTDEKFFCMISHLITIHVELHINKNLKHLWMYSSNNESPKFIYYSQIMLAA